MRHRPFITVVAFLGVLAVLVAGVLVLDGRAKGHIADGVRVGDVSVGGLSPEQARAELRRKLLGPLDQPILVRGRGRVFHLTSRRSHLRADVDAMVADAVARSRGGSIFSRSWRELTGGSVNADLPAQVSFSHASVHRLVTRIERTLDRAPRDASIAFSGTSLHRVREHAGIAVRGAELQGRIVTALTHAGAPRNLDVATVSTRPNVTTSQLAARYPTVITIDRSSFTLRLWKHLRLARSYPIAVGMQGLATPAGLYHVEDKQVNPSWQVPNSAWAGSLAGQLIPPGPQDPLKARWIGIANGAGIHGIDPSEYGSIGTAGSHGCVRMTIPDVIDLYSRTPMHTAIYIA